MKFTIFETPVLMPVLHYASLFLLKITGWKLKGKVPGLDKYVIIGAPHTSNWDMIMMLLIVFSNRQKVTWLGKSPLFKKPFGTVMRWLGGIPVDRSKRSNAVNMSIQLFSERDKLIIVLAPEGTRRSEGSWKTGFYYIAKGAGVPVILGFIDRKNKRCGLGPVFYLTDDIDTDMNEIRKFYSDMTGIKN